MNYNKLRNYIETNKDKVDCQIVYDCCEINYKKTGDYRIFIDYIMESDCLVRENTEVLSNYLVKKYLDKTPEEWYDEDIYFTFDTVCEYCSDIKIITKIIDNFSNCEYYSNISEMFENGLESAERSNNYAYIKLI